MPDMQLTHAPVVRTGMLIRKPVAEVFEAFVNPDITAKFWFTRGSGRLVAGQTVVWTWDMYDISTHVAVKSIEKDSRIVIEWGAPDDRQTVEWTLIPHMHDSTFVRISVAGFSGDGDTICVKAMDSISGFTTVLDGAKAWLEYGIRLNLVEDKFPKGLITP